MRIVVVCSVLALLIFGSSSAKANSALPADQMTEEVSLWLAVAFVAEAGWADPKHAKAEADHRAIYHVIYRRWLNMRKRFPRRYGTFLAVVQGYVAAFDPRKPKGKRSRWLLRLKNTNLEVAPEGWPHERANWAKHVVWWRAALQRSKTCMQGQCSDPYKGKAMHWGGHMDVPNACMKPLPNEGTLNTFYRVDYACAKKARRRKKLQLQGKR